MLLKKWIKRKNKQLCKNNVIMEIMKYLKKHFLVLLGFTFLTVSLILILKNRSWIFPKNIYKENSNSFISKTKVSSENIVSIESLAKETNLQRKIIKLEDGVNFNDVKQEIQDNGGIVFSAENNIVIAELPKENESKILGKLNKSEKIESLEVDYPVFLTSEGYDWGIDRIQAPETWEITQASGIKIGIIDTGIDYNHPDLDQRYAGGHDFVNNDSDPYDDNGHGTHVAGIVSAEIDNYGIIGVAPKALIYSLKILSSDGTGFTSDMIKAIRWAIDNNLQVLNFSLGSNRDSKILKEILLEAESKNILLVAASGNEYGHDLLYPAAYNSVIAVGAIDKNNKFASFSSTGSELVAPGVSVISTIPNGKYDSLSGTSMASPHVTGTIALMLSNNKTAIREILHNTSIDLGDKGVDQYYGYGLINAMSATLGEDVLSPIVSFLNPKNESTVSNFVDIEFKVQDENQIKSVKLLIDSKIVKEWQNPPYKYIWNTESFPIKKYTILAEAIDENNNIGNAQIKVNLKAKTLPSPSANPSPSVNPSPSIFPSPNPSPILSPSPSPNPSPSVNPSPSMSPSPSPNPSPSVNPSPSMSPSPSPNDVFGLRQNPILNSKENIPTTSNFNQRNPRFSNKVLQNPSINKVSSLNISQLFFKIKNSTLFLTKNLKIYLLNLRLE
ncbi:MAG: S8 family serine peptidase [Patescibacteria group bacterium]|nr:S8 family serine peptidase [Patescibacteria group bacterium]